MHTRRLTFRATCCLYATLLLAALPEQVVAGTFGLARVAQGKGSDGTAIVGTIDSIRTDDKLATLTVENAWAKAGRAPRVRVVAEYVDLGDGPEPAWREVDAVQGKTITVKVHTGIEGLPGEDPVDDRLFGHLEFGTSLTGQKVVYAMGEFLPADTATIRKLNIFFGNDGVNAYRAKSSVEELCSDLADYDLYEPAREELSSRKEKLHPHLIAAMPVENSGFDPVRAYLRSADAGQRQEFYAAATRYFTKTTDDGRLSFMMERLQLPREDTDAVAELAELYSSRLSDEEKSESRFFKRLAMHKRARR